MLPTKGNVPRGCQGRLVSAGWIRGWTINPAQTLSEILYSQLHSMCLNIAFLLSFDWPLSGNYRASSLSAHASTSPSTRRVSSREFGETAADLISYIALLAHNVVECDDLAQSLPLPPLQSFITSLVSKSEVPITTLMSCLVYISRLKCRLQQEPWLRGIGGTPYRIFLACLILADKYLNDTSSTNMSWAIFSNMKERDFSFEKKEIDNMEKGLLDRLQWDAHISEKDLERELHLFVSLKTRQEELEVAFALLLLSKRPTTPTGNEPAHYTAKRKGKIGSRPCQLRSCHSCRNDVRWRSISYPDSHQSFRQEHTASRAPTKYLTSHVRNW
jgi:hypothetical protein